MVRAEAGVDVKVMGPQELPACALSNDRVLQWVICTPAPPHAPCTVLLFTFPQHDLCMICCSAVAVHSSAECSAIQYAV